MKSSQRISSDTPTPRVDIKSAQMFLGHSDIEVTLNIYTHLSKFKTDEAIESLNGHLDKLSEMKYEC